MPPSYVTPRMPSTDRNNQCHTRTITERGAPPSTSVTRAIAAPLFVNPSPNPSSQKQPLAQRQHSNAAPPLTTLALLLTEPRQMLAGDVHPEKKSLRSMQFYSPDIFSAIFVSASERRPSTAPPVEELVPRSRFNAGFCWAYREGSVLREPTVTSFRHCGLVEHSVWQRVVSCADRALRSLSSL